jgi:hypothetical protein
MKFRILKRLAPFPSRERFVQLPNFRGRFLLFPCGGKSDESRARNHLHSE